MPDNKGVIDRENLSAGMLRIYLYYRFVLSLSLLVAFYTHVPNDLFGSEAPQLYLSANILYVVVTAISLGFYQLQAGHLKQGQLLLTLLADIGLLTVLMLCSQGLASGIAYLMLVTVAAGAIFFTGQLAVFIPAVASICIIAESILGTYVFERSSQAVFPAGLLGVLLFVASLIFSRLTHALIQAQEAVRSETRISAGLQELNQLIIERMRTGILVVDDDGVIHQINTAAQEMLGGRAVAPLGIGADISAQATLLNRFHQWRQNPDLKPAHFAAGRQGLDVQPNFAALDVSGLNRTIVFLEDLRTQHQQVQQLKLASLGRLTGSIAHEIRNPLGAISHASELLNECQWENPTAARLTQIINTQVKRVNHIVESVLQLSRKQHHNPAQFDLAQWLGEFIDNYRLGNRNPTDIHLELAGNGPSVVVFDQIHLTQVLTNLLDNATHFSHGESGRYWAALRLGHPGDSEVVTLDVLDQGPGVPAEHHNQLFEPFFSTSPGGSGLGLYIARELCDINFASLKHEPDGGDTGACFRIVFAHPQKVVKLSEDAHEHRQGPDH